MKVQDQGEILLTIAIPTYNRAIYLLESLEHIIHQVQDDIEILICDNASTDNTPELVAGYLSRYPQIRYIRNPSNLGPDANFLICLREGRGDYIHILSDDDILLDGSVQAIKDCISNNNKPLSFIHLNVAYFEGKFEVPKRRDSLYKLEQDIFFKDKNAFLEYIGIYATFVSSMVFNKRIFGKINSPEQFIGSYLLQSHLALQTIAQGYICGIVSHVCIAQRGNNTGGYNYYKVFAFEWKRVLFETGLENGFSKKTLTSVYRNTIKGYMFRFTLRLRTSEQKSFDDSGKCLLFRTTWEYPIAWIYLYPLFILPPRGIEILRKIYRACRNSLRRLDRA